MDSRFVGYSLRIPWVFFRHSLDNAWRILGKLVLLSKEYRRNVEGMSKERGSNFIQRSKFFIDKCYNFTKNNWTKNHFLT